MFSIWRNLLPRVRFYYTLSEIYDSGPPDPNRPDSLELPGILSLWYFGGYIVAPLFALSFVGDVAGHHHIHWWYLLIIAAWVPFPILHYRDAQRIRRYERGR